MTNEEAREGVQMIADEVEPGWNVFLLRGDYTEGQWRFQKEARQIDVTFHASSSTTTSDTRSRP